jgi:hypothetical protein
LLLINTQHVPSLVQHQGKQAQEAIKISVAAHQSKQTSDFVKKKDGDDSELL